MADILAARERSRTALANAVLFAENSATRVHELGDIEVEKSIADPPANADGWQASLTYFHNEFENRIEATTPRPNPDTGGSILLWGDLGNGLAIQFEGGLRYAIVDSNVRVQYGVPLQGGYSAVYESPIETDDTVLAIAALQIEYIADNWRLGFGGGYQWDIGKPKQTFLGEPLEDADFSAGLVFATLSFVF